MCWNYTTSPGPGGRGSYISDAPAPTSSTRRLYEPDLRPPGSSRIRPRLRALFSPNEPNVRVQYAPDYPNSRHNNVRLTIIIVYVHQFGEVLKPILTPPPLTFNYLRQI